MLKFGETPPWSLEDFEEAARAALTEKDFSEFQTLSLMPDAHEPPPHTFGARYRAWEIGLRNRLARRRANDLGIAPEKFLREEADFFSELDAVVQSLVVHETPLGREQALDLARWKAVEQLAALHDFDLDAVLAYKLKLALLCRAAERKAEQGMAAFETLLEKIQEPKP